VTRWAAYAAGCLLVLMREKGVRFTDGISLLISSAVPEGKGVSSSAAVEVAVMQALVAAHGIPLTGHELAVLCQKVGLPMFLRCTLLGFILKFLAKGRVGGWGWCQEQQIYLNLSDLSEKKGVSSSATVGGGHASPGGGTWQYR
jgi:hypothetical protein